MATIYTHRDLIHAHLASQSYSKAHPDLVAFYGGRFTALTRLFGLSEDWPTGPSDSSDAPSDIRYLMDLFRDTAARYRQRVSPFDGYMEAPVPIADLYQKFGPRISQAERLLQSALLDLMSDIFVTVFGKADVTVNSDDLLAIGFDDATEPDPIDYW